MRYFFRDNALILRGRFTAASTGHGGGLRQVSTIFNHTVPRTFAHRDVSRFLDLFVAEHGFSTDYFGLLTAVDAMDTCILCYDFLTVFITAAMSNPNPDDLSPHTINIIVYSREGLSDGALLETILTATEAKADALRRLGYTVTGTTTDAVIAAHDGDSTEHEYAGTLTGVGRRVYAAVSYGLGEALKRHEGEVQREGPSFFIYSRYGGDHWAEWVAEDCAFYPCHFEGQSCDFCYCPFYPCRDEELGAWVESSSGGTVWNCSHCILLHLKNVAEYLKKYPEAPLRELKKVREKED